MIEKAEKDFSIDLLLLEVDETAGDVEFLNAISAIETDRIEDIFYPHRLHREHLTTRFGSLFFSGKIRIP